MSSQPALEGRGEPPPAAPRERQASSELITDPKLATDAESTSPRDAMGGGPPTPGARAASASDADDTAPRDAADESGEWVDAVPSADSVHPPAPAAVEVAAAAVTGEVPRTTAGGRRRATLRSLGGSRPKQEGPDPYVGTTIGDRYVVDAIVGEGGMGKVYLAHHKIIEKRVAIKVLHADLARDKEAVGRFVREARAASSIGNPHIVDISDFGETHDGSTYFVMEYLDGVTLASVLEDRGALPPDEICDIALQLCDGLSAAHRQEIVHRDLKPENVTLVSQGTRKNFCKILDFGIAKVSTGASSTKLTMQGAVFGTPHYMSPEQAAGSSVDQRTDVYSLGVMLYEMVSGELPFNADNFMGILTQHMYKQPVPPRALVHAPPCPPGLEAIILKCLLKRPEQRYGDMDALAEDLRRHASGAMPEAMGELMASRSGSFNVPVDYFKSATPPGGFPVGPRKERRIGPRVAIFAGVGFAVVGVAVVLIVNAVTSAQTAPTTSSAPAAPSEVAPAASGSDGGAKVSQVALRTVPGVPDAVAIVGGKVIPLPDYIPVPVGTKLKVTIQRGSFRGDMELSASQRSYDYPLPPEALAPAASAPERGAASPMRPATRGTPTIPPSVAIPPPTPPPPAPPPRKSSTDVVEPW
jgi:serine/threonine-protein kinase